jgi:ABC-type branched-subunit amino acid transport system ATPase component
LTSMLAVRGLDAGYHGQPVVRGVDLDVQSGEIVMLCGPNGAGKTTTMHTIAGELRPLAGEVALHGDPSVRRLSKLAAQRDLGLVPEERAIFSQLSVEENLRVGRCNVRDTIALFPELKPLLGRRAGLLSGGEQQMLALGRALSRHPKLLLIDELSLGLGPIVVRRLFESVRAAADRDGLGILLVEQHIRRALPFVDHVYVMVRGRIVLAGSPDVVRDRIENAYLGVPTPQP